MNITNVLIPTQFSVCQHEDSRGNLCILELNQNIGFECRRIYYLVGNDNLEARGFHAHKSLEQIIICMTGTIRIDLEDSSYEKYTFQLNTPTTAIYVPKGCWREIYPATKDSVLLVLASEVYSQKDYIRSKTEFNTYCDTLQTEKVENLPSAEKFRLTSNKHIDFSQENLNYESFRDLAKNKHLSNEEKIGFPNEYREGYENFILDDIKLKLPQLQEQKKHILDIGCGCGSLTQVLLRQCHKHNHQLYLVDSPEMLENLPNNDYISKVPGLFPSNLEAIKKIVSKVDCILCYSVIQYAFVDTNLFNFIDCLLSLLNVGGRLLIGDIPNYSKRKRFFSSTTGISFHQNFMNTDKTPDIQHYEISENKIDDAVIQSIISRAQLAGFDAYLMPQNNNLPMANRRDDILIIRP